MSILDERGGSVPGYLHVDGPDEGGEAAHERAVLLVVEVGLTPFDKGANGSQDRGGRRVGHVAGRRRELGLDVCGGHEV